MLKNLDVKSMLIGAAILVGLLKFVAPKVPAVASVTSKLT